MVDNALATPKSGAQLIFAIYSLLIYTMKMVAEPLIAGAFEGEKNKWNSGMLASFTSGRAYNND
jgi:hypothetical protein